MSYYFCRILLLILFCCVCIGCAKYQPSTQRVIIVKIPPLPKDNMSVEEYFWHSQKFLFPQMEIPNPIPPALPHSHSLLLVTLEKTGEIKINSEVRADLSNTERLQTELKNIFEMREKNRVFEPNSEKVLKAIAVKANIHQNYGDVLKVIEAIEASGADPIVLELNELQR